MGGMRGKLAAAAALAVVATAAPASRGHVKEYSLGTAPAHQPRYIKAGPDGNIWFADGGTQGGIGRISPTGELFAEFGGLGPVEIAFAADGTAYWAGDKSVGKRFVSGAVVESTKNVLNYAAAVAPNGEFWFSTAEVVEFSPAAEYSQTLAVLERNLAALA